MRESESLNCFIGSIAAVQIKDGKVVLEEQFAKAMMSSELLYSTARGNNSKSQREHEGSAFIKSAETGAGNAVGTFIATRVIQRACIIS